METNLFDIGTYSDSLQKGYWDVHDLIVISRGLLNLLGLPYTCSCCCSQLRAQVSALSSNEQQLKAQAKRWEGVATTLQDKYKTVDLGEYQTVKTELAEAQKQLQSAQVGSLIGAFFG
jgi:hypothetical protein